jgi:hypothetical protein
MAWFVETLNDVVDAELEELPADMRARFRYISLLIEEFGLERVREPHVKHVRGPLWEMRMKGKDGISRRSMSLPLGAGCSRAGVHQQDGEDAKSRDRTGAEASKGDWQ